MKNASKPRILYLLKILYEETDEDHGMTLPELQQRLADFGISSERKSLYRDFDALEQFEMKVGKLHTRPVSYYLESRLFETSQMTLLIDAVQTSKSITKTNSAMLIKRLKNLTSKNTAKKLDARIHVAGRVKMQNESIFQTLDTIQKALSEKRDISFNYMQYDVTKRLRDVSAQDGKQRIKTPLFLIYNNVNYYMLAYDENSSDNIRVYRVDRMHNVILCDKSDKSHKPPAGFSIVDYEKQVLGMYDGEPEPISLIVVENLVGNLIDIFGTENVKCFEATGINDLKTTRDGSPRKWAKMHVKAAPSPVLFGQLAQFGGDVRIDGPSWVKDAFKSHLQKTLDDQDL